MASGRWKHWDMPVLAASVAGCLQSVSFPLLLGARPTLVYDGVIVASLSRVGGMIEQLATTARDLATARRGETRGRGGAFEGRGFDGRDGEIFIGRSTSFVVYTFQHRRRLHGNDGLSPPRPRSCGGNAPELPHGNLLSNFFKQ